MLIIYKKGHNKTDENAVRCAVGKYEYFGSNSGDRYISFSYSSAFPVEWEEGDYAEVRGERFVLSGIPSCKKDARSGSYGAAFVYDDVKLEGIVVVLKNNLFLDYVKGDNLNHYTGLGEFSFYAEKVEDFADRIQANLDRVCGNGEWTVTVKDAKPFDAKSISISSGTTILQALALMNSELDQYFHIRNIDGRNTVIITGETEETESMLRYGKGNGLKSVSRNNNQDGVVTRLHVYGSQRNLPYRYYNTRAPYRNYAGDARYMPNLMLPIDYWKDSVTGSDSFDVYVDAVKENFDDAGITNHAAPIEYDDAGNVSKGSIREGEVKFDSDNGEWDEVYPSIEEMSASDLREGMYAYDTGYSLEITTASIVRQWVQRNETATGKLYSREASAEDSVSIKSNPTNVDECGPVIARLMSRGFLTNSSKIGVAIKAQELADFVNEIRAKAGADTDADASGTVTDNGVKHELTTAEIARIKANTYAGNGRLDEITSESVDYFGNALQDNGVSKEGGYDGGNMDTDGVIMQTAFYVTIPQLCFDMMDFVGGETTMLCMKTGMCAGREFEIQECIAVDTTDYSKGWKLKCARVPDMDVNMAFPNASYQLKPGDRYVLTGILMPDVYVEAAQERLFVQAMEWLAENDHPKKTFAPDVDSKWMAEHPEFCEKITEGMALKFFDNDEGESSEIGLEGGGESVVITQLRIKYDDEPIPKYEVTLSDDKKEQNVIQRLSAASKRNRSEIASDREKSKSEDNKTKALVLSRAGAGNAALDNLNEGVVHIEGLEEINGVKAFKNGIVVGDIVIANNGDELHIYNRSGGMAHFSATGDVVAFGRYDGEPAPGVVSFFAELGEVVDAGSPTVEKPYWGWNGSGFGWISGDGGGSGTDIQFDATIVQKSKDGKLVYGVADGLFATENWVTQQGFLTEHQSLDGYATEDWVTKKGYIDSEYVKMGVYRDDAGHDLFASIVVGGERAEVLGYGALVEFSEAFEGIESHIEDTSLHIQSGERDKWNSKQDAISDLDTIRSNAANGNEAHVWGNHALAGYYVGTADTIKAIKVNNAGHADTADTATTAGTLANGITLWGISGINAGSNITAAPNLYIGTTKVQASSAQQNLIGIGNLDMSGVLTIGSAKLTYDSSKHILAFTDANGKPLHLTASGDVVAYSGLDVEGLGLTVGMLKDVAISSSLSNGQALVWNGSKWVNQTIQQGGLKEVSWSDIKGTAPDLGIFTNNAGYIKSTDISGKLDKNTAITGATKCKITYDSKGLVTAGADLSASDIPNLSWSKITSGKPTTLSGYGITDALTKNAADGYYLGKTAKAADSALFNGKEDSAFVHTTGNETIGGLKTFNSGTVLVGNASSVFRLQAYNSVNYLKSLASYDYSTGQDEGSANLVICGESTRNMDLLRLNAHHSVVNGKMTIGQYSQHSSNETLYVVGDITVSRTANFIGGVKPLTILAQDSYLEGGQIAFKGANTSYADKQIDLYGDTMRFFVNGMTPLLTLDWSVDNGNKRGLLLSDGDSNGSAKLWYDSTNDCFRCNKSIISEGDVVAFGGIGTIESPTLESLTVNKAISASTLNVGTITCGGTITGKVIKPAEGVTVKTITFDADEVRSKTGFFFGEEANHSISDIYANSSSGSVISGTKYIHIKIGSTTYRISCYQEA